MTSIVRLIIRGRVQGVGFRYFVEREADRQGLEGWVRNLKDGSVEVLVRGETQHVDALIARCRAGPPGSRVDEIEVSEANAARLDERPAGIRFATLSTV
jgi:acylphosphatase